MPVAAGISAAGAVGSAGIGALSSIFGSNIQAQSQKNALAQQLGMFNTGLNLTQPFIQAGQSAIPGLQGILGTLSGLLTPGGANTANLEQSVPGLANVISLGQQGAANQGSTTGLGANTALAVGNTTTNLALNQGFTPLINALLGTAGGYQNLVGSGANAASSALGSAVNAGSNAATNIVGQGNALASGVLGAGNALSTGVGGAANALALPSLLSALKNQNAPSGLYGGNTYEANQVAAGNPVF